MPRRTINGAPGDIPDGAPKETALAEFARRVQAAMVERGWNQSELARRCTEFMAAGKEMSRDTISKYINGVTLPGPDRLAALARALGKKPSELLPTRGRPSGARSSGRTASDAGDGRAWLSVNEVVTWDKALKVMAILNETE